MSVVCGTPRCAFECLSWRGALTLFGVFVTPPTNERHICLLQPCTGPRGTVHSNWPATGWQGRGVFTWLLIVLLKLCLVSRAVRRHYHVTRLLGLTLLRPILQGSCVRATIATRSARVWFVGPRPCFDHRSCCRRVWFVRAPRAHAPQRHQKR